MSVLAEAMRFDWDKAIAQARAMMFQPNLIVENDDNAGDRAKATRRKANP